MAPLPNTYGKYCEHMRLLNRIFKPKKLRQFERSLKKGRYKEALTRYDASDIPSYLKSEAQYKQDIYEAISSGSLSHQFQKIFAEVANALQRQEVITSLPDLEQDAVRLADVATTLKNGTLEYALGKALKIKNKEARSQGLRKVAGHMADQEQAVDKIVSVITSIPVAAYANEELRNLLVSKLLRKEFSTARQILPYMTHEIRRGLRPQIDFIERNHHNLKEARKNARDLIHPDDIALTMALIAGAKGEYNRMAQYTRSVSIDLLVGTHATYSSSLAYAGKLLEAINLLENIQENGHEYFLRLGNLALTFPINEKQALILLKTFAAAEHYEGALSYWYHYILEHLVNQDVKGACNAIRAISNNNLRKALAGLMAEFAYPVKSALGPN